VLDGLKVLDPLPNGVQHEYVLALLADNLYTSGCRHLIRDFDFVALQLDFLLANTFVFASTYRELAVDIASVRSYPAWSGRLETAVVLWLRAALLMRDRVALLRLL
jgi:hypothetical protein